MKSVSGTVFSLACLAATVATLDLEFLDALVDLAQLPASSATPECRILAAVRAPDLTPNQVARGELRIRSAPESICTSAIESVSLRLRLLEFREYKRLREGQVLPEITLVESSAIPEEYAQTFGVNVPMYDYTSYDQAMSDPEFWVTHATEREAWSTEAILLENLANLTRPVVTPFHVAVPSVNYPPSPQYRSRDLLNGPVDDNYGYVDLTYQYLATVTFFDGRTTEVPAGYTTFSPLSFVRPSQEPVTLSADLKQDFSSITQEAPDVRAREDKLEKCLPRAQRSNFTVKINLDEGSVVQQGHTLKGRLTVLGDAGSTSASRVRVTVRSSITVDVPNSNNAPASSISYRDLNANSTNYDSIFAENDSLNIRALGRSRDKESAEGTVTAADPSMDFTLEVPADAPTDFATFYSTTQAYLHVTLTALYPVKVAKECMNYTFHQPVIPEIDADQAEEGLWDMYSRVGEKLVRHTNDWARSITLDAQVPVSIVGEITSASNMPAHYLDSGSLAPVLGPGWSAPDAIEFPKANPKETVEPAEDTAQRLLRGGSSANPYERSKNFMNIYRWRIRFPDPTETYRSGAYAGVLWRKKMVADERAAAKNSEDGETQHVFAADA
ncbi:unnamed protein product [Mycena citricolor]|uniref:Uncharacterized protein n=1 Tax=Mycena citricolor TaxID=2018698 RepID=A0AAD2H3K0_9AGAR|nr:unnamed protein product [Mycena citricolor]CAK5283194.1 unnamed protein product [Mycena citricolor]